MIHPLSRFAPSPSLALREGDDTLSAVRPFLGVLSWDSEIFARFLHGNNVRDY